MRAKLKIICTHDVIYYLIAEFWKKLEVEAWGLFNVCAGWYESSVHGISVP